MPSNRIRLTGELTGRRAPVDLGHVHFCAESCVHITPLERVVLEHIARGLINKEIAASTAISFDGVQNAIQRLMRKLGVHDRTTLALTAVASGLIDNPRAPFGTKGT